MLEYPKPAARASGLGGARGLLAGIRFDDPFLAIDWGCDPASVVLSDKDRSLPAFDPTARYFS